MASENQFAPGIEGSQSPVQNDPASARFDGYESKDERVNAGERITPGTADPQRTLLPRQFASGSLELTRRWPPHFPCFLN